MQDDIKAMFEGMFEEMKASLRGDVQALANYAAERTAHLSTLVGQAGFDQAVIAERDNVALRAGIKAVAQADAIDARRVELISRLLAIAAMAIAKL